MARRRYSRLARVEERKHLRSAVFFGGLTVAFLVFLVFFGLPTIIKFSGLLADLGGSDEPIEIFDNTPPAPPQIDSLPSHTNEKEIQIKGNSEAGSTVLVYVSNTPREVVADADGDFSIKVSLRGGENNIYALAKDKAGNESGKSKNYTLVYDKEAPEINITEPDKTSFYGSLQKQINIKGTTEVNASLTINDRFVVINNDGQFTFPVSLEEGENTFEIKLTDQAGNETTETLSLTYTP